MNEDAMTARRKLRTPDAADYCGSSASTFEKLRLTGGGPRYIKIGRRVVYDAADLDEWLAGNRRRSTSDVQTVTQDVANAASPRIKSTRLRVA